MNKAVFFLVLAILPLSLSYFAQISYNVVPCILCIYQRLAFFAILVLSATLYKIKHGIVVILIILGFTLSALIALYHIAVENGLVVAKCTVTETLDDSLIYNQLLNTNLSSCTNKFILFGLSMPTWNFLYSVGVILGYFALRGYKNGIFFKK